MTGAISELSGFALGLTGGGVIGCLAILTRTYVTRFRLGTEARVADDGIADAQWKRFQGEIARLDARINVLEQEVEDCRLREQQWIQRAITAEAESARLQALHLGRGEAHQEAQRIVSADRLEGKRKSGEAQ